MEQQSEFSRWINKKYEDYRKSRGDSRGSLADFAREFGAIHQVVLRWLAPNAKPPRKKEYVNRLVERYGEEAYKAMGIDPPKLTDRGVQLSPEMVRILEVVNRMPRDKQKEAANLLEDFALNNLR